MSDTTHPHPGAADDSTRGVDADTDDAIEQPPTDIRVWWAGVDREYKRLLVGIGVLAVVVATVLLYFRGSDGGTYIDERREIAARCDVELDSVSSQPVSTGKDYPWIVERRPNPFTGQDYTAVDRSPVRMVYDAFSVGEGRKRIRVYFPRSSGQLGAPFANC